MFVNGLYLRGNGFSFPYIYGPSSNCSRLCHKMIINCNKICNEILHRFFSSREYVKPFNEINTHLCLQGFHKTVN